MPATLFQKVWDRHVLSVTNEATLLYIDRHLVHEVTSPQAFDGLRLAGRKVRRPDLTFATIDHNVPTDNQLDIRDLLSRLACPETDKHLASPDRSIAFPYDAARANRKLAQ